MFNKIYRIIFSQWRNLQNLSILLIVNFSIAGLGFITTVKIANTLGKETFGLLAYGLAISAYGSVLVRFGQDRTLVRDLIHYPEKFDLIVSASLILRWIILGIVIFLLVLWKFVAGHTSSLTWSLLMVIIANTLVSMDLQPVYDSWHKISRHAIYNLTQKSLYFSIIWSIIILSPNTLNIFWIGTATLASVSLYLILQHRWAVKHINITNCSITVFRLARKMAIDNCTLLLAAIGTLSFGNLNQLIIKHYCGTSELGSYAAAWQIASIATLLLMQISRIGNPATARVTKNDKQTKHRINFITKYSLVMLIAVSPIAIISISIPEFILSNIYNPEYSVAAPELRIFGIYMIIFSLGIVASQYIVSSGKQWHYFFSVMIGTILSLILCFILIPRFGGVGAAISLLVSHSVSMGLYWIVIIFNINICKTCSNNLKLMGKKC